MNQEECEKWFEDNYHWLEKWLDNTVSLLEVKPGKMTIMERYKGMQCFQDECLAFLADKKRFEHRGVILMSAVFGKAAEVVDSSGRRTSFMSGFLEQTGRLPNKNDKVRFVISPPDAKGPRYLRELPFVRRPSAPVTEKVEPVGWVSFLSDCKIEIL